MQLQSGLGLCNGPSSDFNSGTTLPSGYVFDGSVAGYRACATNGGGFSCSECAHVGTCRRTCEDLAACNAMSHDGNCCFLYEARSCPQSSHADASTYSSYIKVSQARAKRGQPLISHLKLLPLSSWDAWGILRNVCWSPAPQRCLVPSETTRTCRQVV